MAAVVPWTSKHRFCMAASSSLHGSRRYRWPRDSSWVLLPGVAAVPNLRMRIALSFPMPLSPTRHPDRPIGSAPTRVDCRDDGAIEHMLCLAVLRFSHPDPERICSGVGASQLGIQTCARHKTGSLGVYCRMLAT